MWKKIQRMMNGIILDIKNSDSEIEKLFDVIEENKKIQIRFLLIKLSENKIFLTIHLC